MDTTCPCSISIRPGRGGRRRDRLFDGRRPGGVGRHHDPVLPTPAVVSAVADEWVGSAPAGVVLVDLSTNDPDVVRELGERLAESGHRLVEAPLTGGAVGAENRSLMFMVGGDDEAVARVGPVLEPLGRATFHLGGLGLGNTMKLVNSLLAFTTDVGEPRRPVASREGRDPRAGGRRGAAHRTAPPTSTSIAWSRASTTATGPRSSRSSWRRRTRASSSRPGDRLGVPTPRRLRAAPGARAARWPTASATTTGATSSAAAERLGDVELQLERLTTRRSSRHLTSSRSRDASPSGGRVRTRRGPEDVGGDAEGGDGGGHAGVDRRPASAPRPAPRA